MLLANKSDFEAERGDQQALYSHGYRRFDFFGVRANVMRLKHGANQQRLLVAGCGWGYLVDEAAAIGYDAWGCDASPYAIDKARELFPALADRFLLADCTDPLQMGLVRTVMGRIDLCVTEDLLTCLDDAEIAAALAALRGIAVARLIHVVTLANPLSKNNDPRINWKSAEDWAELLRPDVAYDVNMRRLTP